MCVCTCGNPAALETSGQECIANIGIPLDVYRLFAVSMIFTSLNLFMFFVYASQPNGALAGGGSVAVAVGIIDRRQVTRDT